jgi:putative oxidoreductase
MNAAALPLVSRILIAVLFLVAGITKAMGYAGTVGYMAKVGFPAPQLMTVIAIVIEIGGAVLLIVGWKTRWVAWALVVFVLVATFAAHRFWEFDAAQMMNQRTQFLKNFAIIGGLLMLAAFGAGRASADKA